MDDITKDALNRIPTTSGVSEKQANVLFNIAKECKNPIIEYGSLRGRSTVVLAGGSRAGNKVPVYAVDTFSYKHSRALTDGEAQGIRGITDPVKFNVDIFNQHMKMAGVDGLVRVNPCSLYKFEYPGKVGMVFVDANKKQDGLQAIWKRHWDNLDAGGWFVTHDFKYQLLEDGTEKYPGIRDWFYQDIVPMIWGNIRTLEIKCSMLLIRKT